MDSNDYKKLTPQEQELFDVLRKVRGHHPIHLMIENTLTLGDAHIFRQMERRLLQRMKQTPGLLRSIIGTAAYRKLQNLQKQKSCS